MTANISPTGTTSRPPRFSGPDIYESSTCHVFWAPNAPRTVHIRIKPGASDGDPSRWPVRTEKIVDDNGNVRFYVDADEKRTSDWKQKLGRVVWDQHVKPALQKDGNQELCARVSNARITLENFPDHYRLYVHQSQESLSPRTDTYLFGSTVIHQFRSPYEFAMHLVWLVSTRPLKATGETACACRYCSKDKQTDIHKRYKFTRPEPPSSFGTGTKKSVKKSRSPTRKKENKSIPCKDYTKLNTNMPPSASS